MLVSAKQIRFDMGFDWTPESEGEHHLPGGMEVIVRPLAGSRISYIYSLNTPRAAGKVIELEHSRGIASSLHLSQDVDSSFRQQKS